MRLLIENAQIVADSVSYDSGWLLVDGDRIESIGEGPAPQLAVDERVNAGGDSLLPGFIDLHVHGALGHETMDANPDALRQMARYYAQHGVTSFLPTTWTQSRDNILRALHAIASVEGQVDEGATILGAHLEGPYLDHAKRGAQRAEYVRRADRDEALAFLDVGVIRLLSLAPEYDENLWLIAECLGRGITVSAAHTSATYDQMQNAVDYGVTHATHTFNAMTGLHHRQPGAIAALLTRPEVTCELIADGVHVHPAVMRLVSALKGPDRVALITDAVRVAGMPEGVYEKDDDRVVEVKDNAVRLPDGTLSGSVLTMNRGLRNYINATGLPLHTAWRAASLNAARAIGLDDKKGSIHAGKDADLTLIDDNFSPRLTIAEGRVVYRKEDISG